MRGFGRLTKERSRFPGGGAIRVRDAPNRPDRFFLVGVGRLACDSPFTVMGRRGLFTAPSGGPHGGSDEDEHGFDS